MAAGRAAFCGLVLGALAGLARATATLGLRAGFAALRTAGALRATAFFAGFPVFAAFLRGIKFSEPIQPSAGL
jgi:hypothetical protein